MEARSRSRQEKKKLMEQSSINDHENDSAYNTESTSEDEDAAPLLKKLNHHHDESRSKATSREGGSIKGAIQAILSFWGAVVYFSLGGRYEQCPFFTCDKQAKAQVYSLVMVLYMWDKPHYRCGTYQDDMKTNLRNVAIPGTGLPLSFIVQSKLLAAIFLLLGYPVVALIAGFRKGGMNLKASLQAFTEQLLCPQDWFSFWRLNCTLASYHALTTEAAGFKMEDKWTFLTEAEKAQVPVSPWLDAEAIVVKDKNEEGGMGIHFFKNATQGGQWIIQSKLQNAGKIKHLLPENAPLSTLRVITASKGGLRTDTSGPEAPLPGAPVQEDVSSLSCVFRAGRADAATDHDSILFDVDINTGKVLNGTTNMHWYQLGPDKILTTPWVCLNHTITDHPDSMERVAGHVIPNMDQIKALCEEAHFKLLPDVPLAGWDVAITEEAGMCLLEVNLSCNFFRGTFDKEKYFDFISEYFDFLDKASR